MSRRSIALALPLLFCTCEAQAELPASARIIDGFAHCRTIAAAEARADCFDAAARGLEAAVRTKDITIVDRQEVRTARRSLFGFTLPRIGLFDGDARDARGDRSDDREEFKEIETAVKSARALPNNRVELRLAEGDAVWTTTDPLAFPPRPGTKVRIRKGAMGNYFISVAGERSVRGMRLR